MWFLLHFTRRMRKLDEKNVCLDEQALAGVRMTLAVLEESIIYALPVGINSETRDQVIDLIRSQVAFHSEELIGNLVDVVNAELAKVTLA